MLVDDADVSVSDEELDGAVLVGSADADADADVVWSALVAHGHFAFGVDLVFPDAEVGCWECSGGWSGLGLCVVGLKGCASVECPVGANVVVVVA